MGICVVTWNKQHSLNKGRAHVARDMNRIHICFHSHFTQDFGRLNQAPLFSSNRKKSRGDYQA